MIIMKFCHLSILVVTFTLNAVLVIWISFSEVTHLNRQVPPPPFFSDCGFQFLFYFITIRVNQHFPYHPFLMHLRVISSFCLTSLRHIIVTFSNIFNKEREAEMHMYKKVFKCFTLNNLFSGTYTYISALIMRCYLSLVKINTSWIFFCLFEGSKKNFLSCWEICVQSILSGDCGQVWHNIFQKRNCQ